MARHLVSVVVPTYNRADILSVAVESALGQSHRNVEVLIADDGSTDATPDLVARSWGAEPRVRYLRQPNAGASAARNLGLHAATGDFVALLDSDDSWLPWKLELQLACFEAYPPAVMVWTDMDAYGPDGERLVPCYLRHMYSAWSEYRAETLFSENRPLCEVVPALAAQVGAARLYFGDIYSQMVTGNLVHTSTVLFRRPLLERLCGFDVSLSTSGEDYDFHLRTCREGPVAFADVPTIRYMRGRPDRLTRPAYRVHMARNFLTTITRAVERDRARITLSRQRLDLLFAEAHEWLADTLLDAGEGRSAFFHYLRALRRDPKRLALVPRLPLALVPAPVTSALRRAYRAVKGRLRPAAQR